MANGYLHSIILYKNRYIIEKNGPLYWSRVCEETTRKDKGLNIYRICSYTDKINALLNVAPGLWMPMTGVGVSFLPVRFFTQQLFKKAKSKHSRETPTPVIGIHRPWASFSQPGLILTAVDFLDSPPYGKGWVNFFWIFPTGFFKSVIIFKNNTV